MVVPWSSADGWTRYIVAITVCSGVGYLISKDAVKLLSVPTFLSISLDY